MTTFSGSKTPITRGARLFKSSRRAFSNRITSMIESRFVTPKSSAKFLIDSGVYPRLRNPEIDGIRGSSHPST